MPLKFKSFCIHIFLVSFALVSHAYSQTPAPSPQSPGAIAENITKAPTAGEIMRERLSKAKAYIAVRNYNAAIYELENIRRETSDASVNAVANVLLMNSFLEMGGYKRAQDFLNELFRSYKANNANGNMFYTAVAGQVVKGARNQIDRYRALGLMVSDRNLPLEAVNDIERMRETLEVVVTQAKELGGDPTKAGGVMALLEEATNTRSALARDDYDARRWRDEAADSREQLASSRSVIINATDGTAVKEAPAMNPVASGSQPAPMQSAPVQPERRPEPKPVVGNPGSQPAENQVAANKPVVQPVVERPTRIVNTAPAEAAGGKADDGSPMDVGSLISYATKQSAPIYPSAARSMRATGVVKVEITVDESGEVAVVDKATGPALLQTAARDAVRKWKFKPFTRDGQPVKARGFVNFNFTL